MKIETPAAAEPHTSMQTPTQTSPPMRSAAELLMECLQRNGVTTLFGQSIPSPALQLAPRYGIRQVGYRTENAGGVMADGFARTSGSLGLVAAQNGPAATLLVAPLAESLKASTPMLALVQDVVRSQAGHNGGRKRGASHATPLRRNGGGGRSTVTARR